jgi:hypothetical protein
VDRGHEYQGTALLVWVLARVARVSALPSPYISTQPMVVWAWKRFRGPAWPRPTCTSAPRVATPPCARGTSAISSRQHPFCGPLTLVTRCSALLHVPYTAFRSTLLPTAQAVTAPLSARHIAQDLRLGLSATRGGAECTLEPFRT